MLQAGRDDRDAGGQGPIIHLERGELVRPHLAVDRTMEAKQGLQRHLEPIRRDGEQQVHVAASERVGDR